MQVQRAVFRDGAEAGSIVVLTESDWLMLDFDFKERKTWGELRLKDPDGRVRCIYMDVYASRRMLLHRDPAKMVDSGVPGAIPAGEWRLEWIRLAPTGFAVEWRYGCGELPADAPVPEAARDCWAVQAEDERHYSLNRYQWDNKYESAPRWYRGDLHAHSTLSDGRMTPAMLTREAAAGGLDFFAITDHNVLPSGWPSSGPLVIPGMELTSFGRGDWNALGLPAWVDPWGDGHPDGGLATDAGQNRLFEEVGRLGAIRCINHPFLGRFAWRYPETPLASVDAIEIWNSPSHPKTDEANEEALRAWSLLWNEGFRIPGLGGSDVHWLPHESLAEGASQRIGNPTTYVLAENLSASALLAGIRAGHVYVSRFPVIQADIRAAGRAFAFGDDLTDSIRAGEREGASVCLRVLHACGCRLVRIENGVAVETEFIASEDMRFEFRLEWGSAAYVWTRFEIREAGGRLAAVTNPISYGAKLSELRTWGQLTELLSAPPTPAADAAAAAEGA